MELANNDIDLPSLTKANLASILVDSLGLNKREALEMVDSFFAIMAEKLVEGEEVKLSNFATFQVRTKASRPGRNPRTGEPVEINKRRIATFQASALLKSKLQPSGYK
jgi:integration host factor subunit alpha